MELNSTLIQSTFPQFTDQSLISEMVANGRIYIFKTGDIILDPGVAVTFVPLIIEGNLKVSRLDLDEGHELLLYYLRGGETCASSVTCCVNSSVSEVEVIAEEDSVVLGLPPQKLDQWMEVYPEWKAFVMQSYKRRFDELLDTINSIAFTQLDQRLIKHLKQIQEIHKSNVIKTSHQEIATDLNSSREVISRLLKQLERQEKIKLSRNTIELLENFY